MQRHPLDNLLYCQRDLATLCADRPLEWREWSQMNAFHGNAAVLKRYAQLDLEEPLAAVVEHAVPYDLDKPYRYDLTSGLPTFWGVHKQSADLYQGGGMSHSEAIGCTQLYAIDLFDRRHETISADSRIGTLAFPDKSTLLKDTDFDREAWAKKLVALPDALQPAVVCIYWRDFLRGMHRPFVEAGLPVVTCGHLLDGDFGFRLHDLCRRFRYACANDIAGSFALSILSGCRFFHLPGGVVSERRAGTTELLEQDPKQSESQRNLCLLAAPYPPTAESTQLELAWMLVGRQYMRTPEQLQALAAEASQRLRAGAAPGRLDLGPDVPRNAFYALQPRQLDYDGWAAKQAWLRIPVQANIHHLRLVIRSPWKQKLSVLRNGVPYRKLAAGRRWKVELQCSPREDTEFELSGEREGILNPGDPRLRSFRVENIDAQSAKSRWSARLVRAISAQFGLGRLSKRFDAQTLAANSRKAA